MTLIYEKDCHLCYRHAIHYLLASYGLIDVKEVAHDNVYVWNSL